MKHIIGGNPPQAGAEVRTVAVDEQDAGQRLDNFLIRQCKGVPKTHIYRIIRSGEVRVNKGRASAERRIVIGDQIRIPPLRTSRRADDKAQAMADAGASGTHRTGARVCDARAFVVVYEDDALLVIDKPAGVAVHGGSGVSFGVIEQLRMARPQARFLVLVHRLDRETSGLLLVAKQRLALQQLQDQFRARETGKTYLALVRGRWPAGLRLLDRPLRKFLLPDGERRVAVVAADHPDAMVATSLVKVAAVADAFTLLEVTIKTGRTHQIRVHLAAQAHPIAGDEKYGDFALNKALQRLDAPVPLRRMFLHAWRLQFTHPVGGQRMHLQAELPAELQVFLDHAVAKKP